MDDNDNIQRKVGKEDTHYFFVISLGRSGGAGDVGAGGSHLVCLSTSLDGMQVVWREERSVAKVRAEERKKDE